MGRFTDYAQFIDGAMQSWDCPGVAIVIIKGDEVLHESVHGWRDVEGKLALSRDTRFPMASVTKSFTAMSAALLIDDGKLEWDKPVHEYIPEFILDDAYATRHITVRDMLCHRSGMPRHDLAAWRLELSRAEFVKRMRHLKFSASFREKFQYNNLMYYATAHLVEQIAKQKWEDFVQTRIFTPLGMNASNFQPEPPQVGQVVAKGYRVDRDQEGKAKGLVSLPFGLHTELSPGAAGALFSTLADLTQWLKVHVNEGCAGETRIISPDNLKQMHLPQMVVPGGGFSEALMGNTIFAYGMGWFIEPYRGHTLIQHGGNVEGHSLVIGFVPQEKIGVVALTNIAGLPLRDILLYESIDRALDLSDRQWNVKFHQMIDPFFAAEGKGKQTSAEEKVEDAKLSHPLEAYTGTFEREGYPDFAVRLMGEGKGEGSELQASTVGSLDWSTLRHYHYDVFEWHLADFDQWMKVRYLTNDNGELDSIAIPLEPEVDNLIFTRKPLALPEPVIASLIGEYQPPVEGLTFTVTSQAGKLYISQTGSTAEEAKPYALSDGLVGLKIKRVRFDFVRVGNTISHLILKGPGFTLEARRK